MTIEVTEQEAAYVQKCLERARMTPAEFSAMCKAKAQAQIDALPKEQRDKIVAEQLRVKDFTPVELRADRALKQKAEAEKELAKAEIIAVLPKVEASVAVEK